MEHEITNSMLILKDPIEVDNSIESYEIKSALPLNKSIYNTQGQTIEINVEAIDGYYRPSKSFIQFDGYLARKDNNERYAQDVQIALINNAMMYLFTSIEYSLGEKIIETLSYPGQVTSILGYLNYSDDFNTSAGLKQCWSKDTTNNAISAKYNRSAAIPADGHTTPEENPRYNHGFATRRALLMKGNDNTRGNFSFIIPFDHIFGFHEYDKVIYNMKQTLKFTRAIDDFAIHKGEGVTDGKVTLTEITWCIPEVRPSVESKVQLMKEVEEKEKYPLHFTGRNVQHTTLPTDVQNFDWTLSVSGGVEKPRWIIVGFQTAKNTNQTENPAVFNHLNVERAYADLNGSHYPRDDVIVNFSNNQYSRYYQMIDDFKKEYHGINNLIGGCQINLETYKDLYPLIIFDVRYQNETLKSQVLATRLKFYFREGVPANTEAFAVILSDRKFKIDSDGIRMKMLSY